MKLETLEAAWGQQPAPAPAADFAILRRTVAPELRRRSRLLAYEAGAYLFVLLVYPAFSLANFRWFHPAHALLFEGVVALHLAVFLALLAYVGRRIGRHRALRRVGLADVRAHATVAAAAIAAEMRDSRVALALAPLLAGLALLSGYANHAGAYGWRLFGLQAGVLLAIALPVGWACWRHYRVNLKPGLARWQAVLRELEEG